MEQGKQLAEHERSGIGRTSFRSGLCSLKLFQRISQLQVHVRCICFLVGHPSDAFHTSGKTQKDSGNVLFRNARGFDATIVAQDGLKSLWQALDIDTAIAETIGQFPGARLGWIRRSPGSARPQVNAINAPPQRENRSMVCHSSMMNSASLNGSVSVVDLSKTVPLVSL